MESQFYMLQLKFKQLKKEFAEERQKKTVSTTTLKLKTYKSMKFSGKDNKNILTFMECYDAEAKLTVEGFKEWTEPQAISYLLGTVEKRTLEVTLARVAILGGRTITKYFKVLNYLKTAFMDSVKSEKALDKLIHITQHSNINIYIQEFTHYIDKRHSLSLFQKQPSCSTSSKT
jgi:hypothetical protein